MAKKRYARVGAASFPAGDLELVNLNHETVEDEETRNYFLRNFDKTSVTVDGDNEQSNPSNVAVQNGEGAHTLLAPAAQDEISFPPAPILCPVIVHVKQPETCICPVGSQRRFLIVLSIDLPRVITAMFLACIVYTALTETSNEKELAATRRSHFEVLPRESTTDPKVVGGIHPLPTSKHPPRRPLPFPSGFPPPNEKKRIATRLYEEVEEDGESARGQRREMRLKENVGGGELRRRRFAVEETKANAKKERERESRKRRTRKGKGDEVVAEGEEGREEARGPYIEGELELPPCRTCTYNYASIRKFQYASQSEKIHWHKNLQQSSEKCKTSSPKFEFAPTSSHRLPRSGPEWRKGVGKAGGGRMAELDEGGFSDVDSPSTTNPPASSPTLNAARGMKDE
ncbi:hypothetical protein ALC53_05496 [Atta colombica]|uniref:Uncharacterized protein n=1 Tax=Atta colombica TaxID=520822 RepID=A0A195BH71_9HYME|nr:hypothetical protein ALC53_05496 [Atta colombica]